MVQITDCARESQRAAIERCTNHIGEPGLVDVDLAALQATHDVRVDVDAGNLVTAIGEGCR